MDQQGLADVLFETAEERARQHGKTFGDGADMDIRRFCATGARKILEMRTSDRADVIREAKTAFTRLVDEMVDAAGQIEGYAERYPNKIGERTLSEALRHLCPIFPIC